MIPGPHTLAVAVLFAALTAQLAFAVAQDGLVYDETLYIAAGHRHLVHGDFRLNPEHPPLGKMLAGLGTLPLAPASPEWQVDDDQWSWSRRFVHDRNDAGTLARHARVPYVAVTLLLAVLVYGWARMSLSADAALLALALSSFHPSIVAHGHLATTDVPAATAMLGASFAFHRWWMCPGIARAILFGVALGLAAATRTTTGLLVPALVAIALLEGGRARPRRGKELLSLVGVTVAAVVMVLWAVYGFRDLAQPGAALEPIPASLGLPGRILAGLGAHGVLPEAYVQGVAGFLALSQAPGAHPTYLLGTLHPQGSRLYFLAAFVTKSTLAFLGLVLVALVVLIRKWRTMPPVVLHFAAPLAVVALGVSLSRVQIGERYGIAAYPYLILIVAAALGPLLRLRVARAASLGLALGHAASGVGAATGGTLSYANPLAEVLGHRSPVLADSSLDWGQDLPRLATYLRENSVSRVQLAYFGQDDPRRLGIRHKDLPGSHSCASGPPGIAFRGIVAVSPHLVYAHRPIGDPYAFLRGREPETRVGALLIYRFPETPDE